jgi:uncharacterized membrane protein YfhO
MVVLENAPAAEAPPEAAPTAIQPATITSYEANRVTIETHAPAPGWLVLTDTAYPGWEARVDDAPVPIATANYLFRAVRVPGGAHTVTFEYRPRSVWIGLTLTGLAWASILVYAVMRVANLPDLRVR